jgi:low affinity Fe/Cu permease
MPTRRARNGDHAKSGAKTITKKDVNGVKSAKLAAALAERSPPGSGRTRPSWFTLLAQKTALLAGRPATFILAVAVIAVWGITGPLFGYSDTWQLVINTGTTIVTFLMVFLIQHTQNRDALAFQLKLDELIISVDGAQDRLAAAEDLCDEDLEALHDEYRQRAAQTHDVLQRRRTAR